ncbi:exodeoxyribonuclease V subunit beta [Vibrio natriegens]|uniref:RecBCD enzyme subunit RecB n=1 Tax=Vibrio natriegens NBRC 15636 = ATCC 14048 = DSM 759 TaxID=1219067 RepID=A0AAN0Y4G1_VIBNA|nr:exodeoxyribonuclease V subunit beta [Vibrio natriegens]ANQ14038.1 exodeoxyribonuclease V subunit beta [Vibrio natriegens NBRC 15636 = ATCC 14048 = DSM 759]MDX6027763.1 exodeoxyribonuclease V subunit beta [Vibrio natriegens NBRC 15636 = ATCC 14048 = DSM 759]UUI13147.1 exodeoxyribonuclease V subunit beta [Vibrio natriegens]WRS49942.1 exodeoxyribonuclease V subunit beta [Vibrio natriegens NBRC 15636 = ATCC 14048 = DSM 759]
MSGAELPNHDLEATGQPQPTPLEAMTFPLHGARLIEASAGTGKTFTIAGLYLRLLLGHGSAETKHRVPLTVDQILVVTFTEAATAELRDRIRARIHDARIAFARGQSSDPVIQPLLSEFDDHKQAAEILLQAERQMDEAAVYTIHGFCQRMLTQNAFESGSRFNNEFVTDESHLKAQVVADYWRRNFYPLPFTLAGEIRQLWGSPSALLSDISNYLTGAPLSLSVPAMKGSLADVHTENLKKIDELKAQWRGSQDDFLALISDSDINKRSYTKKSLPTWLEAVNAWAATETTGYDYPDKLEKFAQNVLSEKTPKGSAPQHYVFEAIEAFLANPISLKAPLLAHAIEHCRVMLASAKNQKQWLSFDDLLTQLSASIDTDESELLAERIRTLYPVAMIDEFQDTDPLQYSIFSRIYLNNPECGLFMIGDPKQAIYGFRGADIFTYIKARNQVSAHYTLGTNWRSSADMVQAVNQVFALPDSPFIYDSDIPFLPVNYSPNAEKRIWTMGGQKQPALTYWLQNAEEKPLPKGEYLTRMAEATASQIQTILTQAQLGQACLVNGEKKKAVQAGDIAVLVRTGSEGRMIKQALADQGIASVYLSNRDSVFTSSVAQDLQRLLQAVLTPENDRALRASLASELFALDAASLDALNNDEIVWENAVNEFKEYRKLWVQRGVLPMLRAVISKRHIAERLLEEGASSQGENGERVLTDLMHIGELLQQASNELDSDHGLLRWLAQSISDAENGLGGSDDQIQRLESERNLVQIVTIHKSKGLEYDLVFLPFVFSYREASEAKYYDAATDRTVLDITGNDASMMQADKERLAEDLRLIYVALTRAVYACFIGASPLRNGRSTKEPTGVHRSAIGYLVQNGQEGGINDLYQGLKQQQDKLDCVALGEPPQQLEEMYVAPQEEVCDLTAKELQNPIDRNWRITSYSGLVKQGSHQTEHDATIEITGFDIDSSDEQDEEDLVEPERSIFTFPRGARPGTFLHSLFEEIEFTQPATTEENTQIILGLMESEQLDEEWLPILQQLIDTVLATPLDGKSLLLNQKAPSQRLVEMEFLLPIEVLSAPALNRVIQRHDPLSAKAGDLGFQTVQGMLKGFIDLVFEHQGKYYVLDWKSNHLGDDVTHYHGEALKSAMADHRYDLQYQIYALALHRFLRSRLANYQYDQHFGGVYYLFLRGMDGQSDHGIFSAKPTLEFLQEMDRLIDGQTLETRSTQAGQMELL